MSDPPDHHEPDAQGAAERILAALGDHLTQLEKLIKPETDMARAVGRHIEPAWQRATKGEHRLPVAAAVALAIALQIFLPDKLVIHPPWLFPALEGALLVGLTLANPVRINRTSAALRTASVGLIAMISLANAWSSAKLIHALVNGSEGDNAAVLLSRGASVYFTNIIVFALWYWEWDRGGPVARSQGGRRYPDFLFPQMSVPDLAPEDWHPNFLDYLYVSFTNATAFSPTDTMPLTRWAKMLMLLQSSVALLTVVFVVARAVNILK